jgi:hypothetical protein
MVAVSAPKSLASGVAVTVMDGVLDRLGAYVGQRLLLVLELLLLFPLLSGLLGLLVGCIKLLVDLLDALVELVNARPDLINTLFRLSHCGALLRNLLSPLLLGEDIGRDWNRWSG